jgi:hypothetical protein
MSASVNRIDVVGKGKYVFNVGVVILDGYFQRHAIFGGLEVYGRIMQSAFIFVQVFNKL